MKLIKKVFSLSSIFFISFLCGCGKKQVEAPEVDGELAFKYAEKSVAFGSRPSGSENLMRHSSFIAEEARKNGADVEVVKFSAPTPVGTIEFRNVIAEIKGESEDFVIVGCHYDTKLLETVKNFEGANDGASGVGLLLAMIKAASQAQNKSPLSLRFVFFDGEECIMEYSDIDGLYGSRHYLKILKDSGELKKCRAVVVLDMIGDKDLNITLPTGTDSRLAAALFDIVKKQKTEKHFAWHEFDITDDHTPFQKAGIPVIDIIDFEFGENNSYWHTEADTIDKISSESLKTAGDAALQLIWDIHIIISK